MSAASNQLREREPICSQSSLEMRSRVHSVATSTTPTTTTMATARLWAIEMIQPATIVSQALLFVISIMLTQASYETQAISITNHHQPTRTISTRYFNERPTPLTGPTTDPLVLNPDSLYINTRGGTARQKRSTTGAASNQAASPQAATKFVDACPSKMEVLTPYYATNSKGKLRTIVNSELMQQAIQIETCLRLAQSTGGQHNRCNAQPECGCEQKYKWHRLLVRDPNEDQNLTTRGLFMDWFLFPSNCVCRCRPSSSTKHFLRTVAGTGGARRQSQPD